MAKTLALSLPDIEDGLIHQSVVDFHHSVRHTEVSLRQMIWIVIHSLMTCEGHQHPDEEHVGIVSWALV